MASIKSSSSFDAVVVGAGPNGLSCAITCAAAGLKVLLLEAADTIGGGTRTKALTLEGFRHDVCSAIHPLALGSPFFKAIDLKSHGVEWIYPEIPLVHPLPDGDAVCLYQSVDETVEQFSEDAKIWRKLVKLPAEHWDSMSKDLLAPFAIPSEKFKMLRFGMHAGLPATWTINKFKSERTKALFAGMAAHSILPLNQLLTSSFGILLAAAGHRLNWPFPKGGAQQITLAMAKIFEQLGGEIETGRCIRSFDELSEYKYRFLNVSPKTLIAMHKASQDGQQAVSERDSYSTYIKRLGRYRYGPGLFKIDYALREAIPWKNPLARKTACLHIGGYAENIIKHESSLFSGQNYQPNRPFIILAQQSLLDPSRCPEGKQSVWAYCHVPNSWQGDAAAAIEDHIEYFAPGFKDLILAKSSMGPSQLEDYNMNYVGGDINAGMQDLRQMWTRPLMQINPYKTKFPRTYLCSSSTPPGGGVHGMCGFHAARLALKKDFGLEISYDFLEKAVNKHHTGKQA